MKPFGTRIQIEPLEKKELLITSEKNLTEIGKIVAVGFDTIHSQVGDVIMFTSWGVDKVEYEGKSYYFLLESDEFILGKIKM